MKTDIPTELVEARREYAEARAECMRLDDLLTAAQRRELEADRRYHKARAEFMMEVDRQVQELAGTGEGT